MGSAMYAWIWIALGASLGAWLRWGLNISLNTLFPTLPCGTLAANWLGGLLVGILIELFHQGIIVDERVKLGLITGFLGGLTTFSTFSAEAIYLLSSAQVFWFFILVASHLIGSMALTAFGMYIVKLMI